MAGPRVHSDPGLQVPASVVAQTNGSMGFAASLSHDDYDNNVSRMIENVVTRFLDETPFPPP